MTTHSPATVGKAVCSWRTPIYIAPFTHRGRDLARLAQRLSDFSHERAGYGMWVDTRVLSLRNMPTGRGIRFIRQHA